MRLLWIAGLLFLAASIAYSHYPKQGDQVTCPKCDGKGYTAVRFIPSQTWKVRVCSKCNGSGLCALKPQKSKSAGLLVSAGLTETQAAICGLIFFLVCIRAVIILVLEDDNGY